MSEQLPIARTHRPWREPRTAADWMVLVAWVELGAVLGWGALLGAMSWALSGFESVACFDVDERACTAREAEPWFGAGEAVAAGLVLLAAIAALVLARRHLHRGGSRGAALAALAVTPACACVAALLTGVPV
jgi:hypothetical protein